MILELAELIGCFVAGGGITAMGARVFKSKKIDITKINPDYKFGTMSWSHHKFDAGFKSWVVQCPKCQAAGGNERKTALGKICECPDYNKEHFHYKCKSCNYENILRTCDDP